MQGSSYAKLYETDLSISCSGNTLGAPSFVDSNFFDEWFLHLEGRKGGLGIIKKNMIKFIVENEDIPILTPSFLAKKPST